VKEIDFIRVAIGGIHMEVPLYGTPEHTRELAASVDEMLAAVEAESARIDSQQFALKAALAFAAQAADARAEVQQQTQALIRALSGFADRIEALAKAQRSAP